MRTCFIYAFFQLKRLGNGREGAAKRISLEKMPAVFFVVVLEEFRKQTDYISIVFIHTESARAGALVPVSLQTDSSSVSNYASLYQARIEGVGIIGGWSGGGRE